MPDSVEIPAPLSTTTPPSPTTSATGATSVVPGSNESTSGPGDQVNVGRERTAPAYCGRSPVRVVAAGLQGGDQLRSELLCADHRVHRTDGDGTLDAVHAVELRRDLAE